MSKQVRSKRKEPVSVTDNHDRTETGDQGHFRQTHSDLFDLTAQNSSNQFKD